MPKGKYLIHSLHDCKKEDTLKCGVYTITSKSTGKIYVGSTGSNFGFIGRWKVHLTELLTNKHKNKYLQRHFNKYGVNDMEFDIIDTYEKDFVLSAERFWVDALDSVNQGFNLCYPEKCPFRQSPRIKYTKLDHNSIIDEYVNKRLTTENIGKIHNVNSRLIDKLLKSHNIKLGQKHPLVKKEYKFKNLFNVELDFS